MNSLSKFWCPSPIIQRFLWSLLSQYLRQARIWEISINSEVSCWHCKHKQQKVSLIMRIIEIHCVLRNIFINLYIFIIIFIIILFAIGRMNKYILCAEGLSKGTQAKVSNEMTCTNEKMT